MRTWDQGDERVDKSSLSKDLVEFPVISVNGNSWKIFDKGKDAYFDESSYFN